MKAIDADKLIEKLSTNLDNPEEFPVISLGTVMRMIDNEDEVQPERKTGKWIQNDNGTYSCSLCHSWIPEEQYYYAQFCLYCGADMRGGESG